MIDEYFNINLNSIKVPPKLLEKDLKKDLLKLDLSHSNKLYTMIKNYSFSKIRVFSQIDYFNIVKLLKKEKKKQI